MKRTFIGLTIVVLAVTLVATPALATGSQNRHGLRGGGGGHGGTSLNVYGTIEAYNCTAGYIDVKVSSPLRLAGDHTVQITDSTRFKECDGDSSVGIKCSELVEDWQVRIIGDVVGEAWIAYRVIQYIPPPE